MAHEDCPDSRSIQKITWVGIAVNILLSVIKFILGFMGHSQAVVADAVHSLSDLSTDFAIIFGVKFWSKSADEGHPYGHGRIETIITIFIGAVLVSVGVGIGYNALSTVTETDTVPPGWIAFAGACISIVFKEILYRWTKSVGKKVKSPAVKANAWHHRTDALSSAPVAVAVAAAALNPKLAYLDHVGAVIVSVFILWAAWKIVKPGLSEVLIGGASKKKLAEIKEAVLAVKGVKSLHELRSQHIGNGWYLDLHVQVDGDLTVREGHDISKIVEHRLEDHLEEIVDVVVHIEPYEEKKSEDRKQGTDNM